MPVEKEYHPAWWRRWLGRPFLRVALRTLFHALAPVTITGKENVLYGKPYIAALNHVSTFDPPFIGVFWPEQLEALGASDIWQRPGQNILAWTWGGIKVHRGEYDRALFEKVQAIVHSGYAMLIAPEGGRSHKPGMQQAKPGVAFLVELTNVPVIPVGIVGTTDDFWKKASSGKRPPISMHIGKPFTLPPITEKGADRKEARQRNADLVMRHIAGLVPEEYRGFYADNPIFPDAQAG